MSVTIHLHEQQALVKMLEHEYFCYDSDGLAALSALRKLEACVAAREDLTSVARGNVIAAGTLAEAFAETLADTAKATQELLGDIEWSGSLYDSIRREVIDDVCPSCKSPSPHRFSTMWPDQVRRFKSIAGHTGSCALFKLMALSKLDDRC